MIEIMRLKLLMCHFIKLSGLLVMASYASGCAVHYKNVADVGTHKASYTVVDKVQYKINPLPVFSSGGPDAVEAAFKSSKLFKQADRYFEDNIPQKDIFILVETEYRTPDLPAAAFGYLSVSTLTLLPAWSNNDGFNIYYRVYKDGVLIKTFPYESRRFLMTWILLLPFAWVNWMTADEYDAFYSITYEFINDAQPYLMPGTHK